MTATILEPATAIEVTLSEVRDHLRELADNASNEDLLDELSKLLRSARGKVNRAVKREHAAKPDPTPGQGNPVPAPEPKPAPPPTPPASAAEAPAVRASNPVGKVELPLVKTRQPKPVEQHGPAQVSARVERQPARTADRTPGTSTSPAITDWTPGNATTAPSVHARRRMPRWLLAIVVVLAVLVLAALNLTACVAVASLGIAYTGARLGWRSLRRRAT